MSNEIGGDNRKSHRELWRATGFDLKGLEARVLLDDQPEGDRIRPLIIGEESDMLLVVLVTSTPEFLERFSNIRMKNAVRDHCLLRRSDPQVQRWLTELAYRRSLVAAFVAGNPSLTAINKFRRMLQRRDKNGPLLFPVELSALSYAILGDYDLWKKEVSCKGDVFWAFAKAFRKALYLLPPDGGRFGICTRDMCDTKEAHLERLENEKFAQKKQQLAILTSKLFDLVSQNEMQQVRSVLNDVRNLVGDDRGLRELVNIYISTGDFLEFRIEGWFCSPDKRIPKKIANCVGKARTDETGGALPSVVVSIRGDVYVEEFAVSTKDAVGLAAFFEAFFQDAALSYRVVRRFVA